MSLFNALNWGNPGLAAGRFPPSPLLHPLLNIPEIGPEWGQPHPIWWRNGFPLPDPAEHSIWSGSIPIWSRTIPFEAIPYRQNKLGRPAHWLLLGLCSIFHLRFIKFQLPISGGSSEMASFITSIFATHHANWADIQAFLNILLMGQMKDS